MEKRMYKVSIYLSASPSNYWAKLSFADKSGIAHEKTVCGERVATINSNVLQGLIEALRALKSNCMLDIYTESEYLIGPVRQQWLQEWKKNGWKTAKGKQVKNMEQWQQAYQELARHSVKIIKLEDCNGKQPNDGESLTHHGGY